MKKVLIASAMAFACAAVGAAGLDGWSVVNQTDDSAKFKHKSGVEVEMSLLGKLDSEDQAAEAIGQIVAKSGQKCGDPFELNETMIGVDCEKLSIIFRYDESDKELVMALTKCSGDACVPVVELLNEFDKK